MRSARRKVGRIFLRTKHEHRTRQNSSEAGANAGIKVPFFSSVIIEGQWLPDVAFGNGTAECTPGDIGENLSRAGRFLCGRLRLAREQALPRRCFGNAGNVEWSFDVPGTQSRNTRRIVCFQAVAENRLPYVLFLNRLLDKGKSDFVRTCCNSDARRSHALVELFARYDDVLALGFVVFLTADGYGKHLFPIHCNDELVRCVLALDADITFGNRIQQSSVKHILAICRKDVMYKDAAAGADRQSLHMISLRNDGAYRICRRTRINFGIADGEIADTQRSR